MTDRSPIPFARPWITQAERDAVLEVLDGPVLTHGPRNRAFEQEFSAFMGGGFSVALGSGMAALHLAYWQLGIGAGDEVIVAAQTHVATAHAPEFVGATPVFVDCDPTTGNITAEGISKAITDRTKAIGLVHFLGIPCDMAPIMELAKKHDLKVIEDCALAVGARYEGTHVGLIGDAGIFSFYPVKHITTGDGGMLVTRHESLAQKAEKARAFGVDRSFSERSEPGVYDVPTLGINYRMSDINAAIGQEQLKRIDEILERRSNNFAKLSAGLSSVPGLRVIGPASEKTSSSHYCLSLVLEGPWESRRGELAAALKAQGIGTSVYYPHPVPRLHYYKTKYGYDAQAFRHAARISDSSIALPVGPHLEPSDISRIVEATCAVMEGEVEA